MIDMKLSVVLLLCVAAAFAYPEKRELDSVKKPTSFLEEIESEFKDEWNTWKKLYEKEYKSFEEEITKFSIWLSNLRFVNQHNLEASLNKSTFTTALNEYSDLSIYDVRNTMNGYKKDMKKLLVQLQRKFSQDLSHRKPPSTLTGERRGT